MPIVHIPPQLRKHTDNESRVVIPGTTLREIIDGLDARFPGIKAKLLEGNRLRPGLAAAVDNEISGRGLAQKVNEDSEVHFVPAVSGGSAAVDTCHARDSG